MKFRLSLLMASMLMANVAIAATEINLHNQHAAYLQSGKISIQQTRTHVDFNQVAHTRFKQTYNGIPVWKAEGIIHTKHAVLASNKRTLATLDQHAKLDGKAFEGLAKDLSATPSFALTTGQKNKAIQTAKALHGKKANLANVTTRKEKAQPIIFVDENNIAHYAFLTSFYYEGAQGAHKPTYIIDAVNQHVYRQFDQVFTASAEEEKQKAIEEGKARFRAKLNGEEDGGLEVYNLQAGGVGGNAKMGETFYDNGTESGHSRALDMVALDLPLKILGQDLKVTLCGLMNEDIAVLDTSYMSVPVSVCTKDASVHNGLAWLSNDKNGTRWKDDEMNEAYSPSLDAFQAATTVKNFYQDWYQMPALIDEQGYPMKYVMRVHFGRSFENAFWDGEIMTFGDGANMFYPFTSTGVTAHEISHGFTDLHSHIDYSYAQMGALHESFSDMAAVTVENYLTGKNSWDLGREIMKGEGALRYLDNPKKDGRSIDHMKDFEEDTEVHGGAGVTNKAFYLLATTKGWTTRKAFDVMLKANVDYWHSGMTNLSEAACGVVQATRDYGYDVADVRVAFGKVGIDTDQCAADVEDVK